MFNLFFLKKKKTLSCDNVNVNGETDSNKQI